MILDPGFNLTLRPMKYPVFFEMYKAAIKNTWTVEEVDFSHDVTDLKSKLTPAERHWVDSYHNRVYATLADRLGPAERDWLMEAAAAL